MSEDCSLKRLNNFTNSPITTTKEQHGKPTVKILILGDVVGQLGRAMVQKHLPTCATKYNVNAIIVNGENSTGDGRGITSRNVHFFKHLGVDIITSGNHIWAKREVYQYIAEHKDLLRPANFPSGCPGTGVTTFTTAEGHTIGVLNIQGRVFMAQHIDCPFRAADTALTFLANENEGYHRRLPCRNNS